MTEMKESKSRFISALGFNSPDEALAPAAINRTCDFGSHAGSLPAVAEFKEAE